MVESNSGESLGGLAGSAGGTKGSGGGSAEEFGGGGGAGWKTGGVCPSDKA